MAFSFLPSCRVYMMSSLNALQLWGAVSFQDLLCLIDPGLFQWLVCTERRTYESLRMKKDLCAFVLLQTAVIVWVSVGSSSFIHRHHYCRVCYKFFKKRQGPPSTDVKLSRNRQKARMLITVFSCSVLIFIFWCKRWRWRGDHTWTQKKEQAQHE